MNNLEWLKKIKEEDEQYMELNSNKNSKMGWTQTDYRIKFRQLKALEIIAEELIKGNEYLAYIKLKSTKRG